MLDVHAWMGAFAGLFILGVSISGIAIAFSGYLLSLETGALRPAEKREEGLSVDLDRYIDSAVQAAGETFIPLGYLGPNAEVVTDAEMIYGLSASPDAGGEIQVVSFNPATGEATGSFFLNRTLTHELIDFHYTLLAGDAGLVFVAVIGLLMAVLAGLGLYLWWPGRQRVLRKVKSFKISGVFQRKFWRLHSIVGFWLSLLILLWAITGVYWSKPDWFPQKFTSVVDQAPSSMSDTRDSANCDGPVTPGRAVEAALAYHPGTRLLEAEFAAFGSPYHTLYLSTGQDLDRMDGDLRVWVHASCPEVIESHSLEGFGMVGAVSQSIHAGRIFGPLRLPMIFLVGLSLTLLSVTGLYLWWRRIMGQFGFR